MYHSFQKKFVFCTILCPSMRTQWKIDCDFSWFFSFTQFLFGSSSLQQCVVNYENTQYVKLCTCMMVSCIIFLFVCSMRLYLFLWSVHSYTHHSFESVYKEIPLSISIMVYMAKHGQHRYRKWARERIACACTQTLWLLFPKRHSLWLCLYTNQLFRLCATRWTTHRTVPPEFRIEETFSSIRTVCVYRMCMRCVYRKRQWGNAMLFMENHFNFFFINLRVYCFLLTYQLGFYK